MKPIGLDRSFRSRLETLTELSQSAAPLPEIANAVRTIAGRGPGFGPPTYQLSGSARSPSFLANAPKRTMGRRIDEELPLFARWSIRTPPPKSTAGQTFELLMAHRWRFDRVD